jgi:hypothetical protein
MPALNRCPFLSEKLASLQMDPKDNELVWTTCQGCNFCKIDHIATKGQVIKMSISGNAVFRCYTTL